MARVPQLVKAATDALVAATGEDKPWQPGTRSYRELYWREYQDGIQRLAEGYPAICSGMVETAIAGNPLAAKWVSDQLGFKPPTDEAEDGDRAAIVVRIERHNGPLLSVTPPSQLPPTPPPSPPLLSLTTSTHPTSPPANALPATFRVLPPSATSVDETE